MNKKQQKSGRSKERVGRRVVLAANEFNERAGKHFNERFVRRLENNGRYYS